MKKKVIYEANDGKEFVSYTECENYEQELKKQHDNAVLNNVVNILIDLDKRYWPENRAYKAFEDTNKVCSRNPGLYLEMMVRDIFNISKNDDNSYTDLESEIKNIILKYEYGNEILGKYLESYVFDDAKEEAKIRHDFATALRNCKNGYELSSPLHWAFSDKDITELAKLHKSNKFRKKIEDLLEDCNFHYECEKFSKNEYDEFFK